MKYFLEQHAYYGNISNGSTIVSGIGRVENSTIETQELCNRVPKNKQIGRSHFESPLYNHKKDNAHRSRRVNETSHTNFLWYLKKSSIPVNICGHHFWGNIAPTFGLPDRSAVINLAYILQRSCDVLNTIWWQNECQHDSGRVPRWAREQFKHCPRF